MSRRMNRRVAQPDEREGVVRAVAWCKKHNLNLDGLYYDDPIVSADGIHLVLLVTVDHSPKQVQKALNRGYTRFDVVRHTVITCPPEWLS